MSNPVHGGQAVRSVSHGVVTFAVTRQWETVESSRNQSTRLGAQIAGLSQIALCFRHKSRKRWLNFESSASASSATAATG